MLPSTGASPPLTPASSSSAFTQQYNLDGALALLLKDTHRLAEAESLICRALTIDEVSSGAQHPRVASDLNNLAVLLEATNRLAAAEPMLRRALAILEQLSA